MKTIITSAFLLFAVTQMSSAGVQNFDFPTGFNIETQTEQNLQKRILDSFINSFAAQCNNKLDSLIDEISLLYEQNPHSLFLYWKGYALYYNSIYFLKSGDREKAEEELKKGIGSLEAIEAKNSEDLALLSMLYSFSCQFSGFPKVVELSKKASDCIERAKKLDSDNLRVCYVEASIDYYTPQEYGGGKKIEGCLIKALSLQKQKANNPYLPSWGRLESFDLLTDFYIKTKNFEQAKKYIDLGLSEYPDSYSLLNKKSKLKY